MNPGDPRDRALEALLSGGARRPGATTAQCLDTETLAASAEGGLGAQAWARAEAHMAGCAHCQMVMAAIVNSAEEVAPAPGIPERPWWRLDVRWLMPLAGAAAAVVLWMVVPSGGPVPQPGRLDDAAGPAAPQMAEQPAAPQVAENAENKVMPDRARETAARQPVPDTREQVEADTALRANEEPRRAEPDRLAKAEDRPAPLAGAVPADSSAFGRTATDLRSLDPAVRWRLAGSGVVERSTDEGVSWDRFDTGVRTPLRAGACPSASACWVVGDAGVVLLTTDGRNWRRLPPPTSEDLVGIETTDGTTAVVRAASGQRYRTGDAGATWAPVPM